MGLSKNKYLTFLLQKFNIGTILAGIGIGNGWMSPLDQGKYASYLYYHGLLDKHQYTQLDAIDNKILKMIEDEHWLDAWKASDEQLNFILTSLNYSNLYDMSKDQYRPSTMNFWSWLNMESVRKSIHVADLEFSDGLKVYMAMVEDTMRSVKPMLGMFHESKKSLTLSTGIYRDKSDFYGKSDSFLKTRF